MLKPSRAPGARVAESINVTQVLTLIIQEITRFSETFSHIDVEKTLVCIASNRKGSRGGIYGKLVPTRFENGSPVIKHRGKIYTIPDITHRGIVQKYLVYFYMPRFFDLPPAEKLRVIFHELYHINPEFNGDIRRMAAVKAAHGHSREHFDSHFIKDMHAFHEYITLTPYMKFLELSSRDLSRHFSKVTGMRMKTPKPVLLQASR
jgi:hypothetical protein